MMKGISVSLMAVAMTMMVSTLPFSPSQATPTAKPKPMPKWWYYDQMGLREWHKGNKQKSIDYFDQSYKLCKADFAYRKALDNTTKKMVVDVINHQMIKITETNAVPTTIAQSTDIRKLAISFEGRKISKNEKCVAQLYELESFAMKILGENHLMVQNMRRSRNLNLSEQQKRLGLEKLSQGKPVLGTVIAPKWYSQNERDFTPELFTRNVRKAKSKYDNAVNDPTRTPDLIQEKGISYTGGVRHDITKKKPAGDPKQWASRTTVGNLGNSDAKMPQTGWGNGEQKVEPGLANANKWGVKPDDLLRQDSSKRKPWGNQKVADPVLNKPWGNGQASATTDELNEATQFVNEQNNNNSNNP